METKKEKEELSYKEKFIQINKPELFTVQQHQPLKSA